MSSDFDGQSIDLNYLYKCLEEKCGRYFWHRNVLRVFNRKNRRSPENNAKEDKICAKLKIPIGSKDEFFVYVIKLNKKEGDNKDSVYVGETYHHPLKRYLQHLRGYQKKQKSRKEDTIFGK